MKIYISLPISGRREADARREADLIASAISPKGHTPVNPFNVYAGKKPHYFDHICCDLRALLDCDAIYMACGWGLSSGCQLEFEAARLFKKRIILDGKIPVNKDNTLNQH